MTLSSASDIYGAIDATWPAAATETIGPVTLRRGEGGGSRVSAATAEGALSPAQLAEAEALMQAMDQTPLFMIRQGQEALDNQLAEAGYAIKDPVWTYAAPVQTLMSEPLLPVSTFRVWPPLQIALDIWAEGGIGVERVAVMQRAKGARTVLLGRVDDAPAGAAFVAIHGDIAMLHALEIRPDHRRKNMGARLTRAAAFWAAEQGAGTVALLVTQANAPANALYASLGMQRLGGYHYRIKSP